MKVLQKVKRTVDAFPYTRRIIGADGGSPPTWLGTSALRLSVYHHHRRMRGSGLGHRSPRPSEDGTVFTDSEDVARRSAPYSTEPALPCHLDPVAPVVVQDAASLELHCVDVAG